MAAIEGSAPLVRGTFRPAKPDDSHDVLRLYAIAGRAVCARPDELDEVSGQLARVSSLLDPPELLVAQECQRLWQMFRRLGASPKPHLREEAGRAYYRDLEALGQRLDLMPLDPWGELPSSLDEPQDPSAAEPEGKLSWRELCERARGIADARKSDEAKRNEVLDLLRAVSAAELDTGLAALVGKGVLDRGEVQLLKRAAKTGARIGPDDEMLIEIVVRLGEALAGGG